MSTATGSEGPSWDGKLTLTPGAVLYRGVGGDSGLHAHHAVQVMISLDEPFVLEFADDRLRTTAAVIPSGLPHRLHCVSRRLLLVLVEPFGPRGRGIGVAGQHARGREFEDTMARIAIDRADDSDAVRVIDHLVRTIAPGGPERPAQLSEPVLSALRHLERDPGSRSTLGHAAAAADISPSRLTHLFTREMGIPFRRYALWIRLRTVTVGRVTEPGSHCSLSQIVAERYSLPRLRRGHRGHRRSAGGVDRHRHRDPEDRRQRRLRDVRRPGHLLRTPRNQPHRSAELLVPASDPARDEPKGRRDPRVRGQPSGSPPTPQCSRGTSVIVTHTDDAFFPVASA